jgi:hypothetical protein
MPEGSGYDKLSSCVETSYFGRKLGRLHNMDLILEDFLQKAVERWAYPSY